jgi:ABC-2 type transport system permease protein
MRRALAIAAKDVRERIRDRSAIVVGIIAPLGLAAIFSFVFNPIQSFSFSATYAVVNQDGGPASTVFVDQVLGAMEASGAVDVVATGSVDEARRLVEEGADPFGSGEGVDGAFVFPAGFSDLVQSAQPAGFEVIINDGNGAGANVAVAMARSYASQLDSVRLAVATAEHLGDTTDRLEAGARAAAMPQPVDLVDVPAAVKQLGDTTFYAAGLAIFFLFFTVQFGVNGLLEERNNGTLSRLLVAPITRPTILVGKMLTAFLLGMVSMILLAIATTLMFGAEWGNPIGVLILIVAGVVSAMGIMAVVAGFARTAEQAGTFAGIIGVVLGFLGGTFFPIAQAGGLLATLRFLTPHAWFMQGLGDLAGGNLADIVPSVVALLLFGLVTGSVAMVRFRKGLQP